MRIETAVDEDLSPAAITDVVVYTPAAASEMFRTFPPRKAV
ncbi:MAG: hypothetical protein ACK5Q5_15740 [Planctomycetaceae bacterium]